MPELPEVETIRRGLEKELQGIRISDFNVHDRRLLSKENETAWRPRLVGKTLQQFRRHGKYLEIILSSGDRFMVHLRMTGQLLLTPSPGVRRERAGVRAKAIEKATETCPHPNLLPPAAGEGALSATPKSRFVMAFKDGRSLSFVDQRRFGEVWLLSPEQAGPSRMPLGPDALNIPLDLFKMRLRQKKGPIQAVLLDQQVLAGVGNIYAQEALFISRIRPSRKTHRLKSAEVSALHAALGATLHAAILSRGSSSRNYRDVYGEEGSAQIAHAVYRKTGLPCPRCKTPLRGTRVGGRGTVYCPACQA